MSTLPKLGLTRLRSGEGVRPLPETRVGEGEGGPEGGPITHQFRGPFTPRTTALRPYTQDEGLSQNTFPGTDPTRQCPSFVSNGYKEKNSERLHKREPSGKISFPTLRLNGSLNRLRGGSSGEPNCERLSRGAGGLYRPHRSPCPTFLSGTVETSDS